MVKRRVPELGYYFIVTDTEETEQNYMYGLRDSIPKGAIKLAQQKYNGHIAIGNDKPSEMCPCTTVHCLVGEI